MFAAKLYLLSPVIQSKYKYLLSLCLYIHYRTSEGNMELDFTTENDIRIICDDLDTSDPESNSSLRVSSSDLSCLQGMAAHTECRVRDQNLMMQH